MSEVVDIGAAVVRKKMFPWFVVAAVIALMGAGSSGMYFGYQLAEGRAAVDKLQMQTAYNVALVEKEARRQEAENRSRLVEGTFLTALKGIKVVNTTYYQQVEKETEKLVYTDCKVPDTGVDLLNKHIDDVNMRLLGKGK